MTTLAQVVAEKISGSNDVIKEKVIDVLAGREITRRADLVVKAFDHLDSLKKSLSKVKPDQVLYSDSGEKLQEGFSRAKLEEKNKLQDSLDKLSNAIDLALGKGDFSKLFEQEQKLNQKQDKPPSE